MIPINTINLTFMFPFYMMVGVLLRLCSNSIIFQSIEFHWDSNYATDALIISPIDSIEFQITLLL